MAMTTIKVERQLWKCAKYREQTHRNWIECQSNSTIVFFVRSSNRKHRTSSDIHLPFSVDQAIDKLQRNGKLFRFPFRSKTMSCKDKYSIFLLRQRKTTNAHRNPTIVVPFISMLWHSSIECEISKIEFLFGSKSFAEINRLFFFHLKIVSFSRNFRRVFFFFIICSNRINHSREKWIIVLYICLRTYAMTLIFRSHFSPFVVFSLYFLFACVCFLSSSAPSNQNEWHMQCQLFQANFRFLRIHSAINEINLKEREWDREKRKINT